MNLEIKEGIKPVEFAVIQESVGFGKPNIIQVEQALNQSVYMLSAVVDGQTIGMARLVGDMARNVYIQDLFIMPDYQRKGIGTMLLERLEAFVAEHAIPGTTIVMGLMAAKGKEPFYQKHGYTARPNEMRGCGMQKGIEIIP